MVLQVSSAFQTRRARVLMVSWSHGELSGRPEVHLLEVREILLEALAGQNDVSRTTEQPWRAERKNSLQSERKYILR